MTPFGTTLAPTSDATAENQLSPAEREILEIKFTHAGGRAQVAPINYEPASHDFANSLPIEFTLKFFPFCTDQDCFALLRRAS